MLEAAQHNNCMSDNYAIFANSTMYTHSPHRINPCPHRRPRRPTRYVLAKLTSRFAHPRLYVSCPLRVLPSHSLWVWAEGLHARDHGYLLTGLRPQSEHRHERLTWCGPLQKFYNEQALLQCASARIPVAFNADSDINNDKWQTTLQLISQQAAQLSGSQAVHSQLGVSGMMWCARHGKPVASYSLWQRKWQRQWSIQQVLVAGT